MGSRSPTLGVASCCWRTPEEEPEPPFGCHHPIRITGRVAVGRGPAGSTGASSRTALPIGAALPTGTTTGHLASGTALSTRTTLAVSGLALSVMTTGVTAVVEQ